MTPRSTGARLGRVAAGTVLLVVFAVAAFWAVYFLTAAPVRSRGVVCGTVLAPTGPETPWSGEASAYDQDCRNARTVGLLLTGGCALVAGGSFAGGVVLVRSGCRRSI